MVERPRFRAVLLLCGVLYYPALVSAQAVAVMGSVQDQVGGALPGVSVELRPTSGPALVTQTDAQGAFRFEGAAGALRGDIDTGQFSQCASGGRCCGIGAYAS